MKSVEPVPEEMALPPASDTQILATDCEAPFAGIGFGVNLPLREAAAPLPVKVTVVEAFATPVRVVSLNVAVQDSAVLSEIVNVIIPAAAAADDPLAGTMFVEQLLS